MQLWETCDTRTAHLFELVAAQLLLPSSCTACCLLLLLSQCLKGNVWHREGLSGSGLGPKEVRKRRDKRSSRQGQMWEQEAPLLGRNCPMQEAFQ